ncbi:MAG: hypothetical protein C0615_05135 [Desulfuromonas sp.]|nr:MAG: hypothetical protein C0615_05135 [Desulfuromonas sp.]
MGHLPRRQVERGENSDGSVEIDQESSDKCKSRLAGETEQGHHRSTEFSRGSEQLCPLEQIDHDIERQHPLDQLD